MPIKTKQSEAQRIPKLRFSGFFGAWDERRLKDLKLGGFSNGVFNDPGKVGSGYRLINVKDMYSGTEINVKNLTRVELSSEEFNRNKAVAGDIFFTRSSLVKEGIAYSNILNSDENDITFDGHIIRMRPDSSVIFPKFLDRLLKINNIRRQLVSRGKTATMTTIGQDDLGSVRVLFPSLSEQQKIANYFLVVDGWIENLRAQKEALAGYRKGIIKKIFSQEVRFIGEDGLIFGEWSRKRFGDVLNIVIDNRGKTPPIESSGIPLLEVNSLGGKFVDYSRVSKYVSEKTFSSWFRKYLQPNDILFSTVGATALCSCYRGDKQSVVAQNIVGLRFKNENPNFMFYLLTEKRNNHQFKRIEMGGVQPSVKVSQMIKIKFSFPSILEQQKIADFLTSIDNLIESKQQQIAKAEGWKKGLMQGLFV
ncbi:restriction endonuclease subunit S [Candidatus Parcubacteria bacterium]|nr:restriction endonuclease subunit S [Patescibacteria group bacterium]MBU4309791.1 restriction endonuclease subunit S [Patescibacteria group bacterium]MBU4431797.1 restriction endonuclease subunit S [Patescibacteria group bacterium]MBU4578130.1 restriction endonuclease subunit S [Patescibacteria group bacterium]MCG2696667.1 restriction endonuclease subunit S [Candidatus Parcubacteria bacterium]